MSDCLLILAASRELPVSRAVLVLAAFLVLILILWSAGKVPLVYNFRNLLTRWRTTVMTALAFTLVIALLTVMLAFVEGMRALTANSGNAGNVIILSEGATDENFSNLGFSDLGNLELVQGIVEEGGKRLLSKEIYLVANQPIENPPPGRPKRRFLQIRGIEDPIVSAKVHDVKLKAGGEWFSEAGVTAGETASKPDAGASSSESGESSPAESNTTMAAGTGMIECVVGEGLARVLAADRSEALQKSARDPETLVVGDTFQLRDRTWKIVGVMDSAGKTFDSEVWAKQSLVGPLLGKEQISTLVARSSDASSAIKLRDFLSNEYQRAAVSPQIETEFFKNLATFSTFLTYCIGFVTVIIAIGGVVGVMNTMFAAISQRKKDIGVLRLLGYSRTHILTSFLLESVAIALVGGLLGCAIGYLIDGTSATSTVSDNQGGGKFVVLKMNVDAANIAIGLTVALLMGLIGGLIPAVTAMRKSALDSLR